MWCVDDGSASAFQPTHLSTRIIHKWLDAPALCLHWTTSPLWTQERCFSTSAERWRRSLLLFLFTRQFIPSGDVDRTSVGMTRSAARRETTAPPSPVASSSWTRLTTTSPWSPGNFPGCLLCCFSSRWDTSSSERCAPNPGSSPSHTTDPRLLPHRKNCSWRAAHRIRIRLLPSSCPRTMNPSACRHMKRRCGMGAEQLESNAGQATRQGRRLVKAGLHSAAQ